MTQTCACKTRQGVLVDVCMLHAQYGRTLADEAVERAMKTQPKPSKAPSHALGLSRVNVLERVHECENVVKDLDMLWQELHFGYRNVVNEDMINILMGMKQLYHLRFARLKDEFEGYVREASAK